MKHYFRIIAIVSIALSCYIGDGSALRFHAQTATVGSRVASIPFEIGGENYVLVKGRVNGSEAMTFILDSGGGSGLVLYYKSAQALNAKSNGNGTGGGAGEKTFETTSIKGASLSLLGVTL